MNPGYHKLPKVMTLVMFGISRLLGSLLSGGLLLSSGRYFQGAKKRYNYKVVTTGLFFQFKSTGMLLSHEFYQNKD